MKTTDLAHLYQEYATFAWSRVEYWIGLTTAVLAAKFIAGEAIDGELQFLMVLLYTGFTAISYSIWSVGILRVRHIGRDIKAAVKNGADDSKIAAALSTALAHLLTIIVGSAFYLIGWAGTVAYIMGFSILGNGQ